MENLKRAYLLALVCLYSGPHGVDTDASLPEIITQGMKIRVEKGDTARLDCEVAGLTNYVLMWKEKKRVISAGNLMVRKDSRFQISVEEGLFTLFIRGVDTTDSGEYICEVDVMGRPLRITHFLEVLVPPIIQTRENTVELYRGDNYTLSCSGEGFPNPRIVWSKKNGYFKNEGYEGLSLGLYNVDRKTSGTYICTASNGVSRPAKAEIVVRVKYPPEIEMEQVWSNHGTEVEVDCIVNSDPKPQITWFRDSSKIFETDRFFMKNKPGRWSLKIISLRETDFGNYSCKASNGLGKTESFTVISGRPNPPKFSSPSVNYNPSSYNLTWTTDSFDAITEYKLRYRPSKSTEGQEGGVWSELVLPVAFPTPSQHYTLRKLKAGTVYDVVGFARNKYGWSKHSKTFSFYNKGVDFSTQELIRKKEEALKRKNILEATEETEATQLEFSGCMSVTEYFLARSVLTVLTIYRSLYFIN